MTAPAGYAQTRKMMFFGPFVACAGIAMTAMLPDRLTDVGSAVLLVGVGTCVWAAHRFGRLGVEEPVVLEAPNPETKAS